MDSSNTTPKIFGVEERFYLPVPGVLAYLWHKIKLLSILDLISRLGKNTKFRRTELASVTTSASSPISELFKVCAWKHLHSHQHIQAGITGFVIITKWIPKKPNPRDHIYIIHILFISSSFA